MTTTAHGANLRFSANRRTSAPDEVWRLWTSPTTWGEWDRGLRSAQLEGAFRVGAEGWLTDLDGRRSRFRVTEVDVGLRCVYEVSLPAARLALVRTIRRAGEASAEAGAEASVRHEVTFTGALARVWARILGPGFRRQLGPTVDALVEQAEDGRPSSPRAPTDTTDG